jgi:hypothetical protein
MACRVYDIYVVPNYHQIIRPCVDPAFGLYARDEYTQLQFEITACERCPAFPNNAKTRYRKYTQDKVVVLCCAWHFHTHKIGEFFEFTVYILNIFNHLCDIFHDYAHIYTNATLLYFTHLCVLQHHLFISKTIKPCIEK